MWRSQLTPCESAKVASRDSHVTRHGEQLASTEAEVDSCPEPLRSVLIDAAAHFDDGSFFRSAFTWVNFGFRLSLMCSLLVWFFQLITELAIELADFVANYKLAVSVIWIPTVEVLMIFFRGLELGGSFQRGHNW